MSDEQRTPPAPPTSDPLEERLRSFEAFDRLIAENISRSGAMVREAIELRERARLEIAAERAALADLIAAERDRARAEGLARQADMQATISAALADIEVLRAEMDVVAARPRSITSPEPASESPAPIPAGTVAIDNPDALSSAPSSALPVDSARPELEPEPEAYVEPDDVEADVAAPVDHVPDPPTEPAIPAGDLTLVVQGIRRAAAASSLQRHLAAQPGVVAVEPREFAEGIFRLHLVLDAPIAPAALHAWPDAAAAIIERPAAGLLLVTLPT